MTAFEPFADDAATLSVGGLLIENGTTAIVLSGDVEISRSRDGLSKARKLIALLSAAAAILENDPDLPENVAPEDDAVSQPRDPFG
jgi:hypothetical protein